MIYTFNRNENLEEVKEERWVWGVVYKDDTELHQFEDGDCSGSSCRGTFHQIKEIKMGNVKLFSMYKLKNPDKRIDLVVMPEMQLFHFYRNVKPFYSEDFIRIYVFGYKIRDTSRACYHFILPDDRLVISDKDNIDLTKFELRR